MEKKHYKKHSCFDRPFYYEPEEYADYTEHGCVNGAKFENSDIDNPDVLYIFETAKKMNLHEALDWFDEHEQDFDTSTVVIDTDNGNTLSQYRNRQPKVFICKTYLNHVRHLNTLLNRANEELQPNGYFWCHCRTATLKRTLILKHYPPVIGQIAYLMHYVWHRMMAKMNCTKWFYFMVTKGTNRTYNRVEVLGRLYRSGFEVIDEEFRFGEYFVLARKIKEPIWDDTPTSSPIIKLRRIGYHGTIVGVYKFRTMYSYSEYLQPYIYKHNNLQEGGKFADDYRVNGWGRLLRKLWIDEIPMFINVFKGDMKLVGVRPLSPHYYSLYTPDMQQLRIKVKPGLLPPFYYDKTTPKTIDEVQASERRYIEAYLQHPFLTDWRYFWGTVWNILMRGKRSK